MKFEDSDSRTSQNRSKEHTQIYRYCICFLILLKCGNLFIGHDWFVALLYITLSNKRVLFSSCRDALVVSVLDTVTSIISGMVTFSILGAMAHDLHVPVGQVVKEGPGLAFVAYPEALLRLPVPQLWSILFFLMLFILGLDSEVSF